MRDLKKFGDKTVFVSPIWTISESLSADKTLIAAPGARHQIVITALQLQSETQNQSPLRMVLEDGLGHIKWQAYAPAAGDGVALTFTSETAIPVGDNQPLILNLDANEQMNYVIAYYIEEV